MLVETSKGKFIFGGRELCLVRSKVWGQSDVKVSELSVQNVFA